MLHRVLLGGLRLPRKRFSTNSNHGSVIHGRMGNIVPARERRNDDVGQSEPQLRGEAVDCSCVVGLGSWIIADEVAMKG